MSTSMVFLQVTEDRGKKNDANDALLGLETSQVYLVDPITLKLSWNFTQGSTNLLDWIGLFDINETDPLQYIDYKSDKVCGLPQGTVAWTLSSDYFAATRDHANWCFRYFDGLTGSLKASSHPLLVYTDAVLVVDALKCTNLKKRRNPSYYFKLTYSTTEFKSSTSKSGTWKNINYAFAADKSLELKVKIVERQWKGDHTVGRACIPIIDFIKQRNQKGTIVLRPKVSQTSSGQSNCKLYIECRLVPAHNEPYEEMITALQNSSSQIDNICSGSVKPAINDSYSYSSVSTTPTATASSSDGSCYALTFASTSSASASSSSASSSSQEALPPGWEARMDAMGRIIYLDHINRRTTWRPPTILETESGFEQHDMERSTNGNILYQYARRTVVSKKSNTDNNNNPFATPVNFLSQQNFTNILLNGNEQALKLYNESTYLKQIIYKIRKHPGTFEKYANHKELVDFLNFFADKTQPFPPGWQIAKQRFSDQRYFIDHQSRHITLIDPRLPLINTKSPRTSSAPPPTHRHKTTVNGNSTLYEIIQKTDEIAKVVQERFPEIAPRVCYKLRMIKHNGLEALLRYANDDDLITAISVMDIQSEQPQSAYSEKIGCFYRALQNAGYGQGPGKIRFCLRRSHLVTDAYEKILLIDPMHLKRYHMTVTFDDEDGLDYGGPSRELFFLLSRELFNPYYGLFENLSNDNYAVQISPMSKFVDNYLRWFELCGRVLGLALIHHCMIDTFFSKAFYKMMIGLPYKLEDLQSMDSQFYKSLMWIRNNDITPEMELTFHTTEDVGGEIIEYELLPRGKEIKVSNQNKEEFISLMIRWRVEKNTEDQNRALLRGLYSLMDREYLRSFDADELRYVLSGTVEIDIADWQENTVYKSGYFKNHIIIRWFWDIVYTMTNADRLKLLQFVTGTSSVPFEGFAALRGSDGLKKFTIQKYGSDDHLPRAHTCFNRLDLPPYSTQQIMLAKLQKAINESSSYAIE